MGKTVTTYLIDGNPQGTRYVFISNKICKMYVIPRSDTKILSEREELQKPAFYILLGEDETTKPQAYIGETENFKERVKDHDYKKEFWQKALVFISKDQDLTKADVQFLEHRAIAVAKKLNTYNLEYNKQIPKCPNLPEYRKDSMEEFFEDVKFLSSFIGCSIFDEKEAPAKNYSLFYAKGRGSNAVGYYDNGGFTVLKDSILAATSVPSFAWPDKRKKLIEEYASPTSDGKFILDTSKTFPSPSTAADFCIGSSNNGWIVWKNKDGQTLDAIVRKQLEG
ncbi:MAG: GIY-YIG nuclease family protein [Bacteroidales bacterium]|nr:GIY-YIG nuclease family protein [Bacteroidales bacterium]